MWCFRLLMACRPSRTGNAGSSWVLRGEMGSVHFAAFSRIDLVMAVAAFGNAVERTERALASGCDVLPICNDRHSVELVLERCGENATSAASQARLVRMRARGEAPVDLHGNRHWQETVAQIAALGTPPPPLVLTEGEY